MHKEKSWRWGAIASPVHSRGPRASQWAVWWAAECDWSGSGQRHGLVETAGGLAGWRWMTMPLGDARWRWMLDRKCLILWMAQTELPARGGSPVWQSVETHDTDSGRLDDGIDGCACSETTVRPACRGSFPACAVPRRLLRRLEPEAPALSRLSLAGPGHRRRSVVLSSLRHGDRNRQPRQTGDAGTTPSPNQQARSQHIAAGGCKDSTSGDGRPSGRRAGRAGPCPLHGRPPKGEVQDSRSMIGPAGGGPG